MELEKIPVWADVRKIFADTSKPVRFENTGTFHTESEDVAIMKIITIDTVRDYVNNIGDMLFVEFLLPLGDYVKRFYPYRTNMELTIKRSPLQEVGMVKNTNSPDELERFKLIFLPEENKVIEGSEYKAVDYNSLNLLELVHVKVQLINRALEPLRIKTTGGIFKNVKQKNLIEAIMMAESNKITIDGKPAIDGVDIIEPDNGEVQRHVIIPNGTHIASVPTYCQEKMNGVYSSGIGTYLQSFGNKRLWFIYPLFNYARFDENINKAIFYAVPRNRFPGVERTYRKEGDVLYIAATGGKAYRDSAETAMMDQGSGVRFTDARAIMKKPVEITEDGPVAVRNRLNSESAIKDRKDNLNYAPVSSNNITSNPFAQFSRIVQRTGGRVDISWSNANISLIHPGMPCKYIYTDGDTLVERKGVILFIHAVDSLDGEGIAVKAHRTTAQVTIFVEPLES